MSQAEKDDLIGLITVVLATILLTDIFFRCIT